MDLLLESIWMYLFKSESCINRLLFLLVLLKSTWELIFVVPNNNPNAVFVNHLIPFRKPYSRRTHFEVQYLASFFISEHRYKRLNLAILLLSCHYVHKPLFWYPLNNFFQETSLALCFTIKPFMIHEVYNLLYWMWVLGTILFMVLGPLTFIV